MPFSKLHESTTLVNHLEHLTSHRDVVLLNVSVMRSLVELLNLGKVSLYDVMERDGKFYVALSAWEEAGQIECNETLPLEEDVEDIQKHPELAKCVESGLASVSELSAEGSQCLNVPLLLEDRPVAVFSMQTKTPISSHDMSVANGIIGVYRNYLGLLQDSQHDTLTGLLNRKTFDHGLANLLSTMDKQSRDQRGPERRTFVSDSHWLAIIDIDHFKSINDKYGHLYGDEVLILMANLMRREFRQRDRLFRFGGEEFVVLMRNIDADGALLKLESLRKAVSEHVFPQIGNVTVTIGYEQIMATVPASEVLGHADEALYYGKANGRNQVNCYSALLEKGLIAPKLCHTDVELF